MTRPNWLRCSTAAWFPGLLPGRSSSTSAWTRAMTTSTSAAWSLGAATSRTSRTAASNQRPASIPAGEPTGGLWSVPTVGTTCSVGSRFATKFMPKTTLALSNWPVLSFASAGPGPLDRFGTHSYSFAANFQFTAVPEPAALGLIALGGLAVLRSRPGGTRRTAVPRLWTK